MLLRLSRWAVVLVLAFCLGRPWAFVQSVAWIGMVVNYSQTTKFTEALSKTFDGKHPCGLCKLVQKGKAEEKKQDTQKPGTQIDKSVPTERPLAVYPMVLKRVVLNRTGSSRSRIETPPTPPPRTA